MTFEVPTLDWAGLSPLIALTAGMLCVLMSALLGRHARRALVSALTLSTLAASAGLFIWQWGEQKDLVAATLRLDELAIAVALIAIFAAAFCTILILREPAVDEHPGPVGHPEFHALVLSSVLGMALLAQAQNLVTLFISLELLSIPLYILCGARVMKRESLEAGLKYLIIGALGSATLLYGLAFIYGGSGSMDYDAIRTALEGAGGTDSVIYIGIALCAAGFAFKLSIAPFHQWTPDVYEGAPTTVTAFMAVATKAAAFAALVRFFEVALGPVADDWQPALAALAVITILVGNVGALGQDSVKRLLGYSSIAQAGYMLVAVVAFSQAGVSALVFYLAVYALFNLAAFAVVAVRERETALGDDISALAGIGRTRPVLAWSMTLAMLALAGLPGTAGFFGKLYLIGASVESDYTWLGIAIVAGTMISLAYYLRIVAAIWMRPQPPAALSGAPGAPGGADGPRPSGGRCRFLLGALIVVSAATVFFGVYPGPLLDFADRAGEALAGLPR